jgi:hypothetical protein
MLVSIERSHNAIAHPETYNRKTCAFHAPSYNLFFCVGFLFFTINIILGRCSLLRYSLLGNFWRSFSGLLPTFNTLGPLVAFWYFLSTYQWLTMSFGMMVFYFTGIFVLTLLLSCIFASLVDLPV